MKKLLLFALLLPVTAFSQYTGKVGINTDKPTATTDINGNLRVRDIPQGIVGDSILVTNNGFVRKIAVSALQSGSNAVCPTLDKQASHGYYLKFFSVSSIQNPNDPLVISGINFGNSGTWTLNNLYYFSYSNNTGQPLNVSNFTVYFGTQKCVYN